jgi:hypothetical protein
MSDLLETEYRSSLTEAGYSLEEFDLPLSAFPSSFYFHQVCANEMAEIAQTSLSGYLQCVCNTLVDQYHIYLGEIPFPLEVLCRPFPTDRQFQIKPVSSRQYLVFVNPWCILRLSKFAESIATILNSDMRLKPDEIRSLEPVTLLNPQDPFGIENTDRFAALAFGLKAVWDLLPVGHQAGTNEIVEINFLPFTAGLIIDSCLAFGICHEFAHAFDREIQSLLISGENANPWWRYSDETGFAAETFCDDMALSHFIELADRLQIADGGVDYWIAAGLMFRCFNAMNSNHLGIKNAVSRGYGDYLDSINDLCWRLLNSDQRGFEKNQFARATAALTTKFFHQEGKNGIFDIFSKDGRTDVPNGNRGYETMAELVVKWAILMAHSQKSGESK